MPRSESATNPPAIDWRGWLALAWAIAFGLRYAVMVVERIIHG